MKTTIAAFWCVCLVLCLSYALSGASAADKAAEAPTLLSHCVYFSLQDASPEAKQKLVTSCKKHLSQHPGVVFFTAGTLCDEQKGEFNDRDFDVALTIVFTSHEALHTYIRSAAHDEFLAESKSNFKKVRVFDADVDRVAVPADAAK